MLSSHTKSENMSNEPIWTTQKTRQMRDELTHEIAGCKDVIGTATSIDVGGVKRLEGPLSVVASVESQMAKLEQEPTFADKGVPTIRSTTRIIGCVDKFESKMGPTGGIAKNWLAGNHKEMVERNNKKVFRNYSQFGIEYKQGAKRGMALIPCPDYSGARFAPEQDKQSLQMLHAISMLTFMLADYPRHVHALWRLRGFQEQAKAGAPVEEKLAAFVKEEVIEEGEYKEFAAMQLDANPELLLKLSNKLVRFKPGATTPSLCSVRDTSNRAPDEAYASTHTEWESKLYNSFCVKTEQRIFLPNKEMSREEVAVLWEDIEERYAKAYWEKMQQNGEGVGKLEDIDLERDVDHKFAQAVKRAVEDNAPPPPHCIVLADMVREPMFTPDHKASEGQVYYGVIDRDLNTDAVVAVECDTNIHQAMEYRDLKKVAIIINSRAVKKMTWPFDKDPPVDYKPDLANAADDLVGACMPRAPVNRDQKTRESMLAGLKRAREIEALVSAGGSKYARTDNNPPQSVAFSGGQSGNSD